MEIHVRRARADDAETIALFNARLAEESEGRSLDQNLLRAGVAALLADPNKGHYLVAEGGGKVVGQLGLTFEWSDWRNGWFWWIQSVYVSPEWRRIGVFGKLFDQVLAAAAADPQVIGVRLYVENDNMVAHRVYERLGMAWTGYRVMEKHPLGQASGATRLTSSRPS